jgi:hypothetical protein
MRLWAPAIRDQRPLNRARAPGFRNIRPGRFAMSNEMHLLFITGFTQIHRVPDPVETVLIAITGLPIIGRLDGVLIVGQLLLRGETHRTAGTNSEVYAV